MGVSGCLSLVGWRLLRHLRGALCPCDSVCEGWSLIGGFVIAAASQAV